MKIKHIENNGLIYLMNNFELDNFSEETYRLLWDLKYRIQYKLTKYSYGSSDSNMSLTYITTLHTFYLTYKEVLDFLNKNKDNKEIEILSLTKVIYKTEYYIYNNQFKVVPSDLYKSNKEVYTEDDILLLNMLNQS